MLDNRDFEMIRKITALITAVMLTLIWIAMFPGLVVHIIALFIVFWIIAEISL